MHFSNNQGPHACLFPTFSRCTTHVFMHTLRGENIKKYARRPRMTTRGILDRNPSQGLSCSFINLYFTPQYPQQENSSLGPCPSDDDHLVPCSFKQHVGTAYMPSNLESSKPDINTINAVNWFLWLLSFRKSLEIEGRITRKDGLVAHTCNSSTRKAEARAFLVEGRPAYLEASLSYETLSQNF